MQNASHTRNLGFSLMSSIQLTHANQRENATGLSGSLVLLLAAGAGLSVASIYYSQPMLGLLAADMKAGESAVGFIPTLTQLGYALGILLLAPLGDRHDRRRIILIKSAVLAVALLLCGLAPGMGWLLAGSLAVGLAATVAQDIVPAAAALAPDARRGKAVGTVMTGLLLGILLSRVVSGFVAEYAGWRVMYLGAALSIVAVALVAARGLPRFAATARLGYRALLASMAQLWRRHASLRRAVYAQGLLAIGFSAFWSTLAVMLRDHFHLGSTAAGAFGLAGAAGALAAPFAGHLADRRGPQAVARLSTAVAALSFASLGLLFVLPPHAQLALLVASAIGFDFGVQASLVASQTSIYGLEPAARSRLNALLVAGMFAGMAAGAALGSFAFAHWGWMGVVVLATAGALGALAVRMGKDA